MNIMLHPQSAKQFDTLRRTLPQSLLITGERGRGASTVARALAQAHSDHFIELQPIHGSSSSSQLRIRIEQIRQLYDQTRSRIHRSRVILLHDAHIMTPQAQNAFLKLLEEPSPKTHFILTAHHTSSLLPTVLSRVQRLDLRPLEQRQAETLLETLSIDDHRKKAQLLFLAASLPAELTRLAQDERLLEMYSEQIAKARTLLQANTYEKLVLVTSLKDDRSLALQVIDMSIKLLTQSLSKQSDYVPTVSLLEVIIEARDRLLSNGNVRLALAAAVV